MTKQLLLFITLHDNIEGTVCWISSIVCKSVNNWCCANVESIQGFMGALDSNSISFTISRWSNPEHYVVVISECGWLDDGIGTVSDCRSSYIYRFREENIEMYKVKLTSWRITWLF